MLSSNKIIIREIEAEELKILEDMLFEAIYQPEDAKPISRDILDTPEVSVYIDSFGQKKDDYCLVAELNNKIVGATWVRTFTSKIKGYGYVDDITPEIVISLYKSYRKRGIGTSLMIKMLSYLKEQNYSQVSLSVQKENYAVKLYKKLGFEIIREDDEDYIMLLKFDNIKKA